MSYAEPPRSTTAAPGLVTADVFADLAITRLHIPLVPLRGRTGNNVISPKRGVCWIAPGSCVVPGGKVCCTTCPAGYVSYIREPTGTRRTRKNAPIVTVKVSTKMPIVWHCCTRIAPAPNGRVYTISIVRRTKSKIGMKCARPVTDAVTGRYERSSADYRGGATGIVTGSMTKEQPADSGCRPGQIPPIPCPPVIGRVINIISGKGRRRKGRCR